MNLAPGTIIIIKPGRGSPWFSEGDKGKIVWSTDGSLSVDFNNMGNRNVQGNGIWYVSPNAVLIDDEEHIPD